MEYEKIIAGLDIGTTKICVVIGKQTIGEKLEILGMGEAPSNGVLGGMIVNIGKTAMCIKKALRAAEEDSGININIVNVGISGRHTISSQHTGSITRDAAEEEITIEDIHKLTNDMYKILMPPGNEIIHAMPQDYTIDYEIGTKDPVGMSGVKLAANFHIIAAKTNAISNMYKCVKKAGVEIETLMLSSFAASLAVLSNEEKEAGVCLVDIGGGGINIVILYDAIIRYTASIPFGGNIITSDIQQGCMVMAHQAELLKVKFGKALCKEVNPNEVVVIPGLRNRAPKEVAIYNLTCIINARAEELTTLIYQAIIDSGFQEKLIGGIVLTGGGAQLAYIRELMEHITTIDTRIGSPDEYLEDSIINGMVNPSYATSIGLALAGFKALDYREVDYKIAKEIAIDMPQKKQKKTSFSFANMLLKTKSFLVEDYEDK